MSPYRSPRARSSSTARKPAVLHRDAEHAVYRLRSSDGEVIKTCYPVFPGITITYNDVHASYCQMAAPPRQG